MFRGDESKAVGITGDNTWQVPAPVGQACTMYTTQRFLDSDCHNMQKIERSTGTRATQKAAAHSRQRISGSRLRMRTGSTSYKQLPQLPIWHHRQRRVSVGDVFCTIKAVSMSTRTCMDTVPYMRRPAGLKT